MLSKTPDAAFGQAPLTFTYEPTGQRATMTDASGVTSYSYDDRDRLLSKATPFGTLSYAWDDTSNVTAMQSSNANGVWTTYTWDAANRVASLTDQRLGQTTTYERNELGAATRVTYGNAMLSDSVYDPLDHIERREIANAVPPRVFDYTFDLTGRRTATWSTPTTRSAIAWSCSRRSRPYRERPTEAV